MFRFLPLLLLWSPALAQPIQIRVTDARTGAPIPYASVGLVRANQGGSADAEGRFPLAVPVPEKGDTLVVSCVGYQTARQALPSSSMAVEVKLERKEPAMREVVVTQMRHREQLPWNGGKIDMGLTTVGSHVQAARLLEAPRSPARLESVTVATGHKGALGLGVREPARFRLRIYDYDSIAQAPGEELSDSVIEVSGRGVVTVKVNDYGISLPGRRFFVAVQWLFVDENREEVRPAHAESHVTYRPVLRMTKTAGPGDAWWQYHNGTWRRWPYELGITATVAY